VPDLAARTLELVNIASQSRDEAAIVEHVRSTLGARDAGDTCLLAGITEKRDKPLVLLAGHLDTIPAQGNLPGSQDATHVHGAGATDMKAGVAVMIELALNPPQDAKVDLGFVFFGREELPFDEMALTPMLERETTLRGADLAIVLEPTNNELHAGCLGNINATWTFKGKSGHSARPWLADNAITRAAAGIGALAAIAPVEHEFGELVYKEVVSVVGVEGGIARNVIPDNASAQVNMRYAPGTPAAEAEQRLHSLCDPHGALTIDANAPSGPVADGKLVDQLVTAGNLDIAPKQAWTPVAEFGLVGVRAVNFGPGDPALAHMRDERVEIAALDRCYDVLTRFACA
jgi:succinyl-diaminopimelate desuccinylase